MNPSEENLPGVDQTELDLLVDGELSEDGRCELLARLDVEPEGWRRCALAFLESQLFGEDLGAIVEADRSRPGPASSSTRRWVPSGRGRTMLAMAASFLAALVLGFLVRDTLQRGVRTNPQPSDIAGIQGPGSAVVDPVQEQVPPGDNLPQPASAAGRWELVSLPVSGDAEDGSESLRLPATRRQSIDDEWLDSLPTAVPTELLQALQQSGHEIRQERSVLPFRLDDGRRLMVPCDQLEIHYVGNKSYQ